MTEEEREEAQEQMKALNQAYSEVSQQCLDQTTSAEEVRKPVLLSRVDCLSLFDKHCHLLCKRMIF